MYLNIFLGVAVYAAVDMLHTLDLGGPLLLLLSSVVTVVLIILGASLRGFVSQRFNTKGADSEGASLLKVLFSRESILPLFLLAALYMNDQILPATILIVWEEKADLVILILMFSIMAEGIRGSGYFRYMALRVLDAASGSSREIDEERLAISLFFLCSLLSYIFTNDIVVLIMTPIALEICRYTKIRDPRIVLIVVFLAANTMAMGLLIGPPKNIIVARKMGLDFFEYAAIMLVPSLLMVFVGLLSTSLFVRRFRGSGTYKVEKLPKKFTKSMRSWLTVYVLTVFFVVANSFWSLSFIIAGAIVIPGSILLVWRENRGQAIKWPKLMYQKLFAHAPIHIFIFAFVFFAIAEQFGKLLFESNSSFLELTNAHLQESSFLVSATIISLTSFATNVLNDLPASALISEVLVAAGVHGLSDVFPNILFIQSFLVGLGVGAYLGPTATLAAIIWFHQMNRYKSERTKTPTWLDMLRYGSVYFLLTVCVTSLLLPVFLPISALVVAVLSLDSHSMAKYGSLEVILLDGTFLFSLAVAIAIAFWSQHLLRKSLPKGVVRTMMKALIGK